MAQAHVSALALVHFFFRCISQDRYMRRERCTAFISDLFCGWRRINVLKRKNRKKRKLKGTGGLHQTKRKRNKSVWWSAEMRDMLAGAGAAGEWALAFYAVVFLCFTTIWSNAGRYLRDRFWPVVFQNHLIVAPFYSRPSTERRNGSLINAEMSVFRNCLQFFCVLGRRQKRRLQILKALIFGARVVIWSR